MNSSLAICATVLAYSLGTGQITLDAGAIPTVGSRIITSDTIMPAAPIAGAGGADQNWDFSFLVSSSSDTMRFVDPDQIPGNIQGANLATSSNQEGYSYLKTSQSSMEVIGFYAENNLGVGGPDSIELLFDPPLKAMVFPFSYGTSFQSTYSLRIALPFDEAFGDLSMPPAGKLTAYAAPTDSMRWTTTVQSSVLADGWGTLQLPERSLSTLRARSINTTEILIEIKVAALGGNWMQFDPTTFFGVGDPSSASQGFAPEVESLVDTSYSWFSLGAVWPVLIVTPMGQDSVSVEWESDRALTAMEQVADRRLGHAALQERLFAGLASQATLYLWDEKGRLLGRFGAQEAKTMLASMRSGNYLFRLENGRETVRGSFSAR